MKTVIKYIPAATFDEALELSADISGIEFYWGYENCYKPERFTPEALNNDRGFFVCEDTGSVYYIYKNVTKNGRYGAGEELFHKLTIHTSIGAGPFSPVYIMKHIEGFEHIFKNEITIVYKDWDRSVENRQAFSLMDQVVTTL